MEETIAADRAASPAAPTRRIPAQRDRGTLEHAVRYAKERAWDVFPGTWLETVDGVPRCSCGTARCDAPGAHPRDGGWAEQATGSASAARRLWERRPLASVLMPTGRAFDAIDVPEVAGCLALARMERMGLDVGPVTCTPYGRMLFLVLPGAAATVPDLVRRQGWSPGAIDLVTHGEGHWVAAPPTRMRRGLVQWVRQPNAANRWLPNAEEVIAQLAYACGQEAAAARAG
ncbi:bifunctional DNA primase/polymerase [Streptomyces sp. XM4193]|uniref:bifunctional DNA primase/polymerase n=1 Tax=Streptomyces sp. XM4193 TaxID=2929782 RepID=UPI001FFA6BD2|nr:bifunctional DNA primase/polymerase [Streptomyces sp. XM4193]MCK1796716.1 bifunctional DNA primase/polymerase [Streptomyces sp. XM4193]